METADSRHANTYGPRSWYEAFARQRLDWLLDPGSFREFIGPEQREASPHLGIFDLPVQFDDGSVVGHGAIAGQPVFVAAQEGRFLGGAIGEVHGAKLTGLLRAARDIATLPVLLLLDTGGVRLQEANAGELAIAEIMRALIEARLAGVRVIGLIGGRAGCYGGGALIAGSCSALAISEHGRIGVSGPEVIETHCGKDEFDAKDRALVCRSMGGKHRRLMGSADLLVEDTIASFRDGALRLLEASPAFGQDRLLIEQSRLEERLQRLGACTDALDMWRAEGVSEAENVLELATGPFIALTDELRRSRDDAR
jgi:malonate decarboxylase beta subunit